VLSERAIEGIRWDEYILEILSKENSGTMQYGDVTCSMCLTMADLEV